MTEIAAMAFAIQFAWIDVP